MSLARAAAAHDKLGHDAELAQRAEQGGVAKVEQRLVDGEGAVGPKVVPAVHNEAVEGVAVFTHGGHERLRLAETFCTYGMNHQLIHRSALGQLAASAGRRSAARRRVVGRRGSSAIAESF